jgi:hypothetical protein
MQNVHLKNTLLRCILFNKSLELFGSDHSWLAAEFEPIGENLSNQLVEYFLEDHDGK